MSGGNDRPILDEARKKALIGLVGSVVAAAVAFGFMSPELADQINSGWAWVLGAVITALPFVTSVLHALGIVKGAEPKTTPVDSPTGNDGVPMVSIADAQLWRPDVEGAVVASADEPPDSVDGDEPPESMVDEPETMDGDAEDGTWANGRKIRR
ncbi:MAG TPA: hypothetical protein DEQ00_04115 [Mycobacterium tuberculosis]|nr:hypothetical protein [Mycobacterium tuberculosis]